MASGACCLKKVQLDQVTQGLLWLSFEYLQGWKFHNLTNVQAFVSMFRNPADKTKFLYG